MFEIPGAIAPLQLGRLQQRWQRRWRAMGLLILSLGLAVGLLIGLTGCGPVGATPPPQSIVERAVKLSALRARVALEAGFGEGDRWSGPLEPEDLAAAADQLGVHLSAVRSRDRRSLLIDQRPGYRIRGTYRLQSDRATEDPSAPLENAFEIYLQLQSEGKTWRLAYPDPHPNNPDGPDRSDSPRDRRWLTDRLQ
ncbi:MAG: hypothetical protein MH825_01410 [Cyanobacteria bacterium]|nr:hypothetical protein [Cyanobacteriota bacterium]